MKNYDELLQRLDREEDREAAAAIRELQALKTPRSMYEDVKDFHFKFGIPVAGSGPCKMPAADIIEYRTKFLTEEVEEFMDACAEDNLAEAFDALLDIAWVAMGTAHYFGAPWDEGWAEVVRANMDRVTVTRENCPPEKQYRKDMVVKPPGWKPPQLLHVICDYNLLTLSRQKQLNIPEFLRKHEEPEVLSVKELAAQVGVTLTHPIGLEQFVADVKQKEIADVGKNMNPEFHSFACTCEICVGNDDEEQRQYIKGE
jgi:predicted HAD superfamily Cof-like phosphohydrolase